MNVLPKEGVIFRSGSKVLKIDLTISSSPLNTDNIMIRAIVPTATPVTDTAEIILIAFLDFFANRYLLAIYTESFIKFSLL